MNEHEAVFQQYLQRHALKPTRTRKKILDMVFDLHSHFDIEYLYDLIHQSDRGISRATVYRTIPLLVDAGLIQKSMRNETRDTYEHIFGHPKHIHWICSKCREVFETDIDAVSSLIQQEAEQHKFRIREVTVSVQGTCWKCKSENESHYE